MNIYRCDVFVNRDDAEKAFDISSFHQVEKEKAAEEMQELRKTLADWYQYGSKKEIQDFHTLIEIGKLANKGLVIFVGKDVFNEYTRYILFVSASDERHAQTAIDIFMSHETNGGGNAVQG